MPYTSVKTWGHEIGLSACFRQWRAVSHCRFLHGYALSVRVEFEADMLDDTNWVVDFGGLKSLKESIQDTFDHKLVVSEDDPALKHFLSLERSNLARVVVLPAVGCEAFARVIYFMSDNWLKRNGYAPRCRVASVEVREHGANAATYRP